MYGIDKSLKPRLSFTLAVIFAVSAQTACQNRHDKGASTAQSGPISPDTNIVVARIGGEDVFYSDVRDTAIRLGIIETGTPKNNAASTGLAPMDIADFNTALDSLISHKLLAQDAVYIGADKTDAAQKRLAASRELILSSIRVETHIRNTVTEDAMRKLYDTQAALADLGDEIRARHIVVENEKAAKEVAAKIKDGADFEALAAELSIDVDTRDRGGNLGYFTYDMLSRDFVKPIFAAKKGKTLRPFKTRKGWHVAQILDRRRTDAKSYAESREALRKFLTLEAIQELTNRLEKHGDVERVALPLDLPLAAPQTPYK